MAGPRTSQSTTTATPTPTPTATSTTTATATQAATTPTPTPAQSASPTRDPDRPLSWRGWLALAACVVVANAALLHHLVRGAAPVTVSGPRFADDFDRAAIGGNYFTTGMHWRILDGQLWAPEAKNNPLWLQMRLPRDVAIEFDARSETASGNRPGDIKFEIFGNGRDHASGYVCVFGGWGNSISVIARLDEHGADRKERRDPTARVEPGRTYHVRVERAGRELRWSIDGKLFMTFDDPRPLEGEGHDRFGFSSWESDVFFDHLRVEPL